jgi:hypothetical protein
MRLLTGVLGTALLGLSACAELGIQFPDLHDPAETAETPVLAEQALSNTGRFPEDMTEEVAARRPLPPPPVRKPEVSQATIEATRPPQADPDALIGLDFDRTTVLLGAPALLIEQPPAKIWAYNGPNCTLRIFFYPRVGGSDFRVLTYEVRSGQETVVAKVGEATDLARQCLSELLVQAEAGRPGETAPPAPSATGAAGGS